MRTSVLIGYKTASDLVGKICFFLIVVYAARVLPTREFGLFALATTLGWLLSVASDFGLQLHLARSVARRPGAVGSILARWLRPRLVLAAAALALAVPATFVIAPGREAWPFFLIVCAQVASSLVEFLNHAYRGLSRSDIEASLNLAQRLATLAAVGLLALAPTLGALALALAVPAAGVLAVSAALAFRLSRRADGGARPDPAPPSGRFATDVWPIGAGIVLSALYFRLDLFFVEYWHGVEAAALYNAVFRLVEAMRLVPAAVLAVVFPLLCRAGDLRILGRLAGGLAAAGAVAAVVLAWPAGWFVMFFYGPSYAAATPAFRVLLVAVPLFFLNYALTHQLIGWDRQKVYAAVSAAALAANLALDVALVPRFGLEGAAWATVATEVVVTAGAVAALAWRGRRGREPTGLKLAALVDGPRMTRGSTT